MATAGWGRLGPAAGTRTVGWRGWRGHFNAKPFMFRSYQLYGKATCTLSNQQLLNSLNTIVIAA